MEIQVGFRLPDGLRDFVVSGDDAKAVVGLDWVCTLPAGAPIRRGLAQFQAALKLGAPMVLADGCLAPFVRLYRNQQPIDDSSLDEQLHKDDCLTIVMAVAGG